MIFTLACLGAVLIAVPAFVVGQIEVVRQLGETWVYVYLSLVGLGAAILLGCTLWIMVKLWSRSRSKRERQQRTAKNPSQLTAADQNREVEENLAAIEALHSESDLDEEFRQELEPMIDRFTEKRASQKMEIVAFGTISSGKSSLLNALAGEDLFQTDVKGGTTTTRNEIAWTKLEAMVEGAEIATERLF